MAETSGNLAISPGGQHAACDAVTARLLDRIRRLEAALRHHTHSFTDKGQAICGGCLQPSPCPDTGLISSEEPK